LGRVPIGRVRRLGRGRFRPIGWPVVRAQLRRVLATVVRRLVPALVAMLTAVVAAAWWLLPPGPMREFGQSVGATTFFVSNVYYWLESGYFAPAAEDLPLLHTWSLAVEEQYYVFFPLLLFLLARYGRRMVCWSLAGLAAASFVGAAWLVSHEPDQGFYLAHARAWELFIGALLAYDAVPRLGSRVAREVVAGAGMLGIVAAIVFYDSATPFPGVAAALPCLGAAAIIHAGSSGDSTTARLLGSRVAVGIGLISYSLYLWHWPVFVFMRHITVVPPTVPQILFAICLIVAAAWASWRFVEQPFRGRDAVFTRPALFAASGVVLVVFGLVGGATQVFDGFPSRFAPNVLAIAQYTRNDAAIRAKCFGLDAARLAAGEACHLGPEGVPPEFLIWGDSHSVAMLETLMHEATEHRRAGLYLGATGCPPLFEVSLANRSRSANGECHDTADYVRRTLASTPSLRTVLLIARWGLYVEARGVPGVVTNPILLSDADAPAAAPARNLDVVKRGLRRTLPVLLQSGRRVVVLESIPEVGVNVPGALTQAAILGRRVDLGTLLADYHVRQARTVDLFNEATRNLGSVTMVPVASALCDEVRCRVEQDGEPLYYDDNHLSARGARLVVPAIARAMGWTDR
jgi:peptidoglycan/LPS O-acetylase OafA/YrhL